MGGSKPCAMMIVSTNPTCADNSANLVQNSLAFESFATRWTAWVYRRLCREVVLQELAWRSKPDSTSSTPELGMSMFNMLLSNKLLENVSGTTVTHRAEAYFSLKADVADETQRMHIGLPPMLF